MGDGQRTADHQSQATLTSQPWHARPVDEVLADLGVDPDRGLTSRDAAERLAAYGPNSLPEEPGRSVWRMIFDQVADPMIALLVVAAIISGVIGEPADTIVIAVIVLIARTRRV